MPDPFVSIIVPAFNAGHYLDQAIESLLNQTYKSMEVIVIDDGSTPPCTDYSFLLTKVHMERQSNNGPASARNRGITLARGTLIGFHDADDISDRHRIEKQVHYLMQHESAGFVLTLMRNFLDQGVSSPSWFAREAALPERPGFIPTALIRRECLEQVGAFDPTYAHCEDLEWIVRAHDCGICGHTIPESLYMRRIHDQNLSCNVAAAHAGRMRLLRESIQRRRVQEKHI